MEEWAEAHRPFLYLESVPLTPQRILDLCVIIVVLPAPLILVHGSAANGTKVRI
jgi:hypothetical protein